MYTVYIYRGGPVSACEGRQTLIKLERLYIPSSLLGVGQCLQATKTVAFLPKNGQNRDALHSDYKQCFDTVGWPEIATSYHSSCMKLDVDPQTTSLCD